MSRATRQNDTREQTRFLQQRAIVSRLFAMSLPILRKCDKQYNEYYSIPIRKPFTCIKCPIYQTSDGCDERKKEQQTVSTQSTVHRRGNGIFFPRLWLSLQPAQARVTPYWFVPGRRVPCSGVSCRRTNRRRPAQSQHSPEGPPCPIFGIHVHASLESCPVLPVSHMAGLVEYHLTPSSFLLVAVSSFDLPFAVLVLYRFIHSSFIEQVSLPYIRV